MQYFEQIFQSEVDPGWSVKGYPNGYYYFKTGDENDAIEPMHVPQAVRDELGPQAQELMNNEHNAR